ncbi:substrate-binding domain-containing protein [Desulfosporosinus fructosivorans]
MSKNDFTRREVIWMGALGVVQLGILGTAASGFWNLKTNQERPKIQLSQLQVPPEQDPDLGGKPVLNIAVASVISPMENVNLYGDLLNIIGERVNMKVKMVQRQNYTETNRLIEAGEVQLGFICSGALIGDIEKNQIKQILVTPQIAGSTTYSSYIIAPSSSSASSLLDLKGKSFAYMDPLSFSGRIAPQVMLKRKGYQPDNFFGQTVFTYSHDKSIRAVAEGIVDGAAVDSLIYDLTMARDESIIGKIKVIDQSEAMGNPPVVVSQKANPELIATLKNVLLTMHMDEQGRKAMELLHFDRFVHPDQGIYEKIQAMAQEVGLT